MLKRLCALFAVLGIVCSAMPAAAAYPERPITIVVPFGAGGETDIVARLLARSLAEELGQNVAVQNIVGAAGVTGMSAVVNAKPDGYTLGFTVSAPLAIHPHMRDVPYELDDFTFIARIFDCPHFIVTQKNSPWKSIDDAIAAAKSNPSQFFWASSGVGSMPYMALFRVWQAYGVTPVHVPFTGDADAFQAMAGDRVQVYTTSAGTLDSFDIKPLVFMGETRNPSYPDVPTFKDLGKNLTASQWAVLMGPKDLPESIQKTLSDAVAKASQSPAFVDAMEKLHMPVAYLNAADTRAFIGEESASYAELIKSISKK